MADCSMSYTVCKPESTQYISWRLIAKCELSLSMLTTEARGCAVVSAEVFIRTSSRLPLRGCKYLKVLRSRISSSPPPPPQLEQFEQSAQSSKTARTGQHGLNRCRSCTGMATPTRSHPPLFSIRLLAMINTTNFSN